MLKSIIDNPNLVSEGGEKIQWYRNRMKIVKRFHQRYSEEKTFKDKRILICMHCEPKGVVRTEALLASGAKEIVFVGNLGSTKPEAAAYLASLPNVTVMAKQKDTLQDINEYIQIAITKEFDIIMDNGASVLQIYHELKPNWKPIGAIEETRSGQLLLETKNINPSFPLLVIDDSDVKRLVENEAGVGQSVVDGYMRATSSLIGGQKILIIGYGYCGSGIAQRFRALGALTMVYDIEPLNMLKARIEGHAIGRLEDLLKEADGIITVTGRFDIINDKHIQYLKDKAVLCNAGHYNMEINNEAISNASLNIIEINDEIKEYKFENKSIYILQNANPINLSSGSGNPIEIMDLGYALQLLSMEAILNDPTLEKGIMPLTKKINDEACNLCLDTWWN